MTVSRARNILAFIGFCTVLYMFGTWAIEMIDAVKVWLEGTNIAR